MQQSACKLLDTEVSKSQKQPYTLTVFQDDLAQSHAASKSRQKKKSETNQLQNQYQEVPRRIDGLEEEI